MTRAAQMGWKRRWDGEFVMIQANHGLTMIRLAECVEKCGCTDFSTALTAAQSAAVCNWCSSAVQGMSYKGHRPPAPRIWWPPMAYLAAQIIRHRRFSSQSASLVLGWCLARTPPRPTTNTPPARGSRSCTWCSTLIIWAGLCCTEKIKAIDKFVLDSPCDHFLAENI
ncbi:hypothetical protein N431DRAFT_232084 [Stipitochalara longipes BDJ]|nr:hypothetical protein N431DRAFT_232084 [Stipitochalara longipes BDJ]